MRNKSRYQIPDLLFFHKNCPSQTIPQEQPLSFFISIYLATLQCNQEDAKPPRASGHQLLSFAELLGSFYCFLKNYLTMTLVVFVKSPLLYKLLLLIIYITYYI